MVSFWRVVNKVIRESDILLHVIDARDLKGTRNLEIENKVAKASKKLILVVNKCDLVERAKLEKTLSGMKDVVFVSSTEYHGIKMLKDRIIIYGKKHGIKPKVGVLGYPNVGKSSLSNAMKGKGVARTSSQSGFTKGAQFVSTKHFLLLDTPGVLSYEEGDKNRQAIMGSIDFSKVKDPVEVVYRIQEENPGVLEKFYGVKGEDIVEEIAMKMQLLVKGGEPDEVRTAKYVLRDWQSGKIRKEDEE